MNIPSNANTMSLQHKTTSAESMHMDIVSNQEKKLLKSMKVKRSDLLSKQEKEKILTKRAKPVSKATNEIKKATPRILSHSISLKNVKSRFMSVNKAQAEKNSASNTNQIVAKRPLIPSLTKRIDVNFPFLLFSYRKVEAFLMTRFSYRRKKRSKRAKNCFWRKCQNSSSRQNLSSKKSSKKLLKFAAKKTSMLK